MDAATSSSLLRVVPRSLVLVLTGPPAGVRKVRMQNPGLDSRLFVPPLSLIFAFEEDYQRLKVSFKEASCDSTREI